MKTLYSVNQGEQKTLTQWFNVEFEFNVMSYESADKSSKGESVVCAYNGTIVYHNIRHYNDPSQTSTPDNKFTLTNNENGTSTVKTNNDESFVVHHTASSVHSICNGLVLVLDGEYIVNITQT